MSIIPYNGQIDEDADLGWADEVVDHKVGRCGEAPPVPSEVVEFSNIKL